MLFNNSYFAGLLKVLTKNVFSNANGSGDYVPPPVGYKYLLDNTGYYLLDNSGVPLLVSDGTLAD